MALTPAQQTFIDKYILDQGLNKFRAAANRKLYEKFAGRYNKATEALDVLPQNHPQRTHFQAVLDAANTDAEQGNFIAARRAIEDTKNAARQAANGYANLINIPTLRADLKNIQDSFEESKSEIDLALRRLDIMIDTLQRYPKAADKDNYSEAIKFVVGFDRYESQFRSDMDTRLARLKDAADAAQNRGVDQLIKVFEGKLDALDYVKKRGDAAAEEQALGVVSAALAANNGLYSKTTEANKRTRAYLNAYLAAVADIRKLDSFAKDETNESVALEELHEFWRGPGNVDDLLKKLPGNPKGKELQMTLDRDEEGKVSLVIDRLLAEEKARVDRAKARYMAERDADKKLTDGTGTAPTYPPTVPVDLDQFDADTVLGGVFPPGQLPAQMDANAITQKAQATRQAMTTFLQQPNVHETEEFLDLVLQTKKELFVTMATAAGVPTSPDACTDEHRALVDALVASAQAAILEHSPNKMNDDRSEIKVGNVVYKNPVRLGGGANGEANRFTADDGTSIVVKTLNDNVEGEDDGGVGRAPMVKEMKTHARLLKDQENTTESADGIAEMKGAAVSADGALHMILADAGGADLKNMSRTMNLMADVGVLPPEARQALANDMLAQTINGLKYMEEKNLIHNDLKPENIMMAADGTVKIIDFGESRFADAQGKEPSARAEFHGTTQPYEAPEEWAQGSNEVTKSVDVFSLGGIFAALGGGRGELPGRVNHTWKNEKDPMTAMDRVVDAALSDNPDDRPSLATMAESAFLNNVSADPEKRDHLPADVKDLKAASAEFAKELSALQINFAKGEFKALAGDFSMSIVQNRIEEQEFDLSQLMARYDSDKNDAKKLEEIQNKIDAVRADLATLQKKRDAAISQKHDAGKAQYDALMNDENQTILIGDKDTKISEARKTLNDIEGRMSKKRGEWYRYEAKFTKDLDALTNVLFDGTREEFEAIMAQQQTMTEQMERERGQINGMLIQLDIARKNIVQALDTHVAANMTDDIRFFKSQEKLKNAASAFGH